MEDKRKASTTPANEAQLEEILEYLAGGLDADAAAAFKTRVDSDARLRSRLEDERLLNASLDRFIGLVPSESLTKAALKSTLAKVNMPAPAGRLIRLAWAAGIAAALVLGAFVAFQPADITDTPNNPPVAQFPPENGESADNDGFTFDDLEALGISDAAPDEVEGDREAKMERALALIESHLKGIDEARLEAMLDPELENLRRFVGREAFWRGVAENINPLEPAAFERAYEKFAKRLGKPEGERERGQNGRPPERGQPERRPGGAKGGEDMRPEGRGDETLARRIAKLLLKNKADRQEAWLDAMRERAGSLSLESVKESHQSIRRLKGADERFVRMGFEAVGMWRMAMYRSEHGAEMAADKLSEPEVLGAINEVAAFQLMTLLSFDRRRMAEVKDADGMRSALLESFRNRFREWLGRDAALLEELKGLGDQELEALIREHYEISMLAGRRGPQLASIMEEHLLYRLSGGERGSDMLDPKLRDDVKRRPEHNRPGMPDRDNRDEGNSRDKPQRGGPRGERRNGPEGD